MNNILNILKVILTRPLFLYLLLAGIILLVMDYQAFRNNAVAQTMSRLSPPINYFLDFYYPDPKALHYKAKDCLYYHQKVSEFFPYEKSQALAMKGYCYESLGDSKRALKAYQQSVDANPHDFWPIYNMGLISFKRGDYAAAVKFFEQALQRDLKASLTILFQSKVYTDVRISDPQHLRYDFLSSIKQGRENAYIFLMEALVKLENYPRVSEIAFLGLREGLNDPGLFYFYAGKAEFHMKAYDKAVKLLQMAINKNPKNAEAFLYLGYCMHMAGQDELANPFLVTAKEVEAKHGSLLKKYLASKVQFF